jgi:hypothetical protein
MRMALLLLFLAVLSAEEISLNPKVNLGRVAAVHSIQGQRSHMEDAFFGDYTKGFFAVYGKEGER